MPADPIAIDTAQGRLFIDRTRVQAITAAIDPQGGLLLGHTALWLQSGAIIPVPMSNEEAARIIWPGCPEIPVVHTTKKEPPNPLKIHR